MKELMTFDLKSIGDFTFVSHFVAYAYQETSEKFNVEFNGSKGYLSHITISAEGHQKSCTNRINRDDLLTQAGKFRKKTVTVSHSFDEGVVVRLNTLKGIRK